MDLPQSLVEWSLFLSKNVEPSAHRISTRGFESSLLPIPAKSESAPGYDVSREELSPSLPGFLRVSYKVAKEQVVERKVPMNYIQFWEVVRLVLEDLGEEALLASQPLSMDFHFEDESEAEDYFQLLQMRVEKKQRRQLLDFLDSSLDLPERLPRLANWLHIQSLTNDTYLMSLLTELTAKFFQSFFSQDQSVLKSLMHLRHQLGLGCLPSLLPGKADEVFNMEFRPEGEHPLTALLCLLLNNTKK